MPKASEVAAELRRVADGMDREPDTEIVQPILAFYTNKKEHFLAMARLLPRPLKKEIKGTDPYQCIQLGCDTGSMWFFAKIERNSICEVIEPAKPAVYNCPPLLSEEDEALIDDLVHP